MTDYRQLQIMEGFNCEEDFYSYFEQNYDEPYDAIEDLIKVDSTLSMYVIVQILGNESVINRLHWEVVKGYTKEYINSLCSFGSSLFNRLRPNLWDVVSTGFLTCCKIDKKPVAKLSYQDFKNGVEAYSKQRKISTLPRKKKRRKGKKGKYKVDFTPSTGCIYNDYQYGLSDW
jgi:hypothetical protein